MDDTTFYELGEPARLILIGSRAAASEATLANGAGVWQTEAPGSGNRDILVT